MNATTTIIPRTDALVTELSAQMADVIMRDAETCLPEQMLRRTRTAVERLCRRGDIREAQALVTDQVMVWCLSGEISRHFHDCPICSAADIDGLICYVMADYDRREAVLHNRIAAAGGF